MRLWITCLAIALMTGGCEASGGSTESLVFDSAVAQVERRLRPEALEELVANCDEVYKYHLTLGAWVRDEFNLWDGKGELFEWFDERGVSHPDNMSSIILRGVACRHRDDWLGAEQAIAQFKEEGRVLMEGIVNCDTVTDEKEIEACRHSVLVDAWEVREPETK